MRLPPFVASGLDLVLFDLDGTLVDTELLHFQAYRQAFERVGIADPDFSLTNYCHAKHGVDGEDTLLFAAIRQRLGDSLMSPGATTLLDAVKKAKKDIYHGLLEQALESGTLHMVAGAQSTMQAFQNAGVLTTIVTHSTRSSFDKLAAAFPCLASVDLVITRDDCHTAKPSPEW